jgi:hypothetical protein
MTYEISAGDTSVPGLALQVTGSTFAWYCDTHHQECFKVLEQVDRLEILKISIRLA